MSKYLVALLLFVPTLLDVKSLADTQNTKDRDRHDIARGSDVSSGEFPFVVFVFRVEDREEGTGYGCTGSLLAPDWVLTAAHCLDDEDGVVVEPEDVKVYTGHDFTALLARRIASRLIIHPRYSHLIPGSNDIALIHLDNPFSSETV